MAAERLVDAYLAGRASAFLPEHFGDAAARARAVARAARPLDARVLSVLREQNAGLPHSAARDANLLALERGAAVVVTGQQLGLFLGPLYTLYKAASAIAWSRELAAETGTDVVPVFWLQTEDHDLPEIAACAVPRDGSAPRLVSVPADASARVSIAHACLPEEVGACVAALAEELGRLPFAAEHLERLARAYQPGATWASAFAQVLGALFEHEGLLVIDPRDARLSACIAGVHRRALEDAAPIARALLERCSALQAAGFAPQVHVREGAPLCFFHARGASAERYRLMPCTGGYTLAGDPEAGEHTLQQLLEALQRDPLAFSSSALLRPIVQDTLLPTAAYVGGPSEVDYFAQVGPLYAAFERPMPLIVPRARFCVLEEKTRRALERLGLSASELSAPRDAILARLAAADGAPRFSQDALVEQLRARFDAAIDETIDSAEVQGDALRAAREKTRATTHAAAGKLVEKIQAARAQRDEGRVRDVERLRHALFPNGEPQERVIGLAYFAARYGERAFIDAVLRAIDPLDPRPKELML